MRARLVLQSLLCGLALQFGPVVQAADVLFDNGASNQDDGWEMTQVFEADDFAILEKRAVLSGVKFWNYAKTGGFTGSITWEIYTNSSNGPGQLLASGMSQASSHTQTGFVMFGTLYEAVTTFDISPAVTLDPGTYWLALHNGPREYTTRGMFWAPTGKKNSSGTPSHSREVSSQGAWSSNDYPGMSSELAFQILGTGGATATPTPAATATPSPTATPTPQPSPSPSATPPPAQRQLLNIATRVRVQTGENVLIGGVIVTGNAKKKVIIRAIGPSLSQVFSGALSDPALELYRGQTLLAANDDWKESQRQEIEQTGIAPSDDRESAIVYTLEPGFYTAVLSGRDGATGIGVIEAYDLDQAADSKLANIATRGFVETEENVMIGGLIVGGSGNAEARILLRAIGPSLSEAGVSGALQDPVMELRNANGALVRENDDWEDTQRAAIEATTLAPKYGFESAILVELPAGNYTALVRGQNGSSGVGTVEVYNLK